MSTLNSYLAARTNSVINQNSSSTVDSLQNSRPPIMVTAPRNGTLTKQKSQKYTK